MPDLLIAASLAMLAAGLAIALWAGWGVVAMALEWREARRA